MKQLIPCSFGVWLKNRRKMLDLTQLELAKRVGCAAVTIQKIEANERRPSKAVAERLAAQLKIPIQDVPAFVRFARMDASACSDAHLASNHDHTIFQQFQHPRTNLPILPSPLIGRDQDIVKIRRRLLSDDARLITLVGPPGVGKTSLAIQAAFGMLDEFEDGVYFVSLDNLRNAQLVLAAVARVLGVNRISERSYPERLKEYLHDKQLLLVLDNFEHVLAAAPQLSALMAGCPWLYFLVTSRSPLLIHGEHQVPIEPLAMPAEGVEDLLLEEYASYPAIALFVERVRDAIPDFTLTIQNAACIAAICRRLDGLPLAIELAAARASLFSPQILLEQLQDQSFLYTQGPRDAGERHHTLYLAIDWSWALLKPDEKSLLARLSVFRGSWRLESAVMLMVDLPPQKVIDLLAALVNNHLVMQMKGNNIQLFALLETVRNYTGLRLEEQGQTSQVRQRHAEIMLVLAEEANRHMRTADQRIWIDRLEAELSNLHSALSWFIDVVEDFEKGLRLAGALSWFWIICSHVGEGRIWLEKALQHTSGILHASRIDALNGAAGLAWEQGHLSTARAYAEESVALARAMGPSQNKNLALSLGGYASIAMYQADKETVWKAAKEALLLFKQIGDVWGLGLSLCLVAEAYLLEQDISSARTYFEEGLNFLRKSGDRWGTACGLMYLGYTNTLLGNLEPACDQFESSILLFGELGEKYARALTLGFLAHLLDQQGNFQQAAARYAESLDLMRKMGIESKIAEVQYNMAHFVQMHGYFSLADKLYKESLAIYSRQKDEEGMVKCQVGLASFSNAAPRSAR